MPPARPPRRLLYFHLYGLSRDDDPYSGIPGSYVLQAYTFPVKVTIVSGPHRRRGRLRPLPHPRPHPGLHERPGCFAAYLGIRRRWWRWLGGSGGTDTTTWGLSLCLPPGMYSVMASLTQPPGTPSLELARSCSPVANSISPCLRERYARDLEKASAMQRIHGDTTR